MKVVCVTHYFPSRKGGIESVASEINQRLAARGHEVEWFASAPGPDDALTPCLQYRPIPSIDLIERWLGIPFPIWLSRRVYGLRISILSCDVVHIHDFIYPGSLIALAWGRLAGKPVILTQHIGYIPYKNALMRALLTFINQFVGRIALNQATRVVFISNAVENYFRQFIKFRRESAYIPNGVDCNIYFPIPDEDRVKVRNSLGVGISGKPVCLFVGRFVEKKGLSLLSQVVARTPTFEWLFAGDGPINPARWGFSNLRIFKDRQRKSLADLYRAADLLVLPSRGEGFPLVVQEALACGTPVLVSDEVAEGCVNALPLLYHLPVVGYGVVEKWHDKMLEIFSRYLDVAMDQNARVLFAKHEWSWEAVVDQYACLYKS